MSQKDKDVRYTKGDRIIIRDMKKVFLFSPRLSDIA
jgi:hypothetical protein